MISQVLSARKNQKQPEKGSFRLHRMGFERETDSLLTRFAAGASNLFPSL